MKLLRATLDELTIEDERSFRHVALYGALKETLLRDKVAFRISPVKNWDRALFLNLTFWGASDLGRRGKTGRADPGDVLPEPRISADTLMHVAWHHVARRALPGRASAECFFLGESVASAFDIYLVGRLLGHAPKSEFLETQVPAMAEVTRSAGLSASGFGRLLREVARHPERAFEDLRALLYDAALLLFSCNSLDAAASALARLDARRFGPLLHHYELSNWILYARAYGEKKSKETARAKAMDGSLRRAGDPLGWLEENWLPFSGRFPAGNINLARQVKRS